MTEKTRSAGHIVVMWPLLLETAKKCHTTKKTVEGSRQSEMLCIYLVIDFAICSMDISLERIKVPT